VRPLIDRLFPRDPHEPEARLLYGHVVSQARAPRFYENLGVPDSVDGRFELLLLHAFLMFDRLRVEGDEARELSDSLFALMVYDFDQSLRVSGVGDLGVGPRMKRMGEAFYGRLHAYTTAAGTGSGALAAALRRNLYGTCGQVDEAVLSAMADYVLAERLRLRSLPVTALLTQNAVFGAPPERFGPEAGSGAA